MDNVVRNRRIVVEDSFYANHHAVHMGFVKYTVFGNGSYRQPSVIVIEVREHTVSRHWDFVDHTLGPIN